MRHARTATPWPLGLNGATAYKSHLLYRELCSETWHISRDGQHIGSASSLESARAIVDLLAEEEGATIRNEGRTR